MSSKINTQHATTCTSQLNTEKTQIRKPNRVTERPSGGQRFGTPRNTNVLHMCERELGALDLTINVTKSCCLRIGARNNVVCQPLYSLSGTSLPWVTEIK